MLSPPESTQRKEHRKGSRAQAEHEAEKADSWAVLYRLPSPSCSLTTPKIPAIKGFLLSLCYPPYQVRAPLPLLFLHTECQSCHLSYSLHLPSFPPQPNPSDCYSQALPELLLCQGVSIVCGRIWTRPAARSPTSPTTGARLSCSSLLGLLPVWHMALCTRHMLGRKGEG